MSTEWFLSDNSQINVMGALRKFKKVNCEQSASITVGDIVYIYIPNTIQAVKFRCQVNKVGISKKEIEDHQLNIFSEFDEYDQYMELGLLEEFSGSLFSRVEMEKHGFIPPLNPVRVLPETKEYLDLVQKLQHTSELLPDKHDGSYELLRETIKSYKNMKDHTSWNFLDLNLVYLTVIGTWKQGVESKKTTIQLSHLPDNEKKRLITKLDEIWEKAKLNQYSNRENGNASVGLFGTGFFSFKNITDDTSSRVFIEMCIDILDREEDREIFECCKKALNSGLRGMGVAVVSMVLHCLKPNLFPIFNGNMGRDNIYVYFGLDLYKKNEVRTYINNCNVVKNFRDTNFSFKNYRILDMASWNIGKTKEFTKENLLMDKNSHIGREPKKEKNYFDKNLIFYGPPGTGKTYQTKYYAVAICDVETLEMIMSRPYTDVCERYDELVAEGRIKFTTFHQSYGYEEFIEGIKPVLTSNEKNSSDDDNRDSEHGEVKYDIFSGIFKKFCDDAEKDDNPHVFIIDEINRGNISKIFGELITLIEDSKRKGMQGSVSVTLPYSREIFSVPSNVYILGTMNTADRSIALIDTALRRRFKFIAMEPDVNVLHNIGADTVSADGVELDVAKMLETINKRIAYLYDREHTIGHTFFIELAKDNSLQKLADIFSKSIIPLLQEYFYEDYQKIQFVLGDNGKSTDRYKFIKDSVAEVKILFKGNVEDVDLPEKIYEVNAEAFTDIHSYLEIV